MNDYRIVTPSVGNHESQVCDDVAIVIRAPKRNQPEPPPPPRLELDLQLVIVPTLQ